MNPKLEVRGLHLHFGRKHVLKNVSLSVPARSIVALIGPSGCGKSTLLRSMNRMHDFTPDARIEGQVLLDGEDIYGPASDETLVRRRIGMVFQRPNPFPRSIFQNVAYGLEIGGMRDKKQVAETVESSLRRCYLWEEVGQELGKSALALSGGQQQRLCIARAIAVAPEVVLMDEPCSALDPISTAKIEELMLQLKERYTLIIVTHNMQQAQRVADFTAFMYLGELIEYAPTAELFGAPKQVLTANYVGGRFG